MHLPRILITTAYSENRKTMLTATITRTLIQRGCSVSYFACGTDFLAPRLNSRLLDIRSRNLDTYFCDDNTVKYLLASNCANTNFAVMEGMQRFYDGVGDTSRASCYDLSRVTDTPVILIINASDFSVTNVSMLKGLINYKAHNNISGIIFNRATKTIYRKWKSVIEKELGVELLGFIPDVSDYLAPSMYLLTDREEADIARERLIELSGILANCIDFDALIRIAESAPDFDYEVPEYPRLDRPVRIGVARDNAFRLYYEDNHDLLRTMGAETVLFSPLNDEKLPEGIDGLLLGGGHPELYAEALSLNEGMKKSIYDALKGGMPCMAFGGGFMYLCDELYDYRNLPHKMVGLINAYTYPADEPMALGHLDLISTKDTMLGAAGTMIKGHCYHEFSCNIYGDAFMASKEGERKTFNTIYGSDVLIAGLPHLYYYSNPGAAFSFLETVRRYSEGL